MISEATKLQDTYQSAFRALQATGPQAPGASWLQRLRESAGERFEQLGFPGVENEEWRYTNVSQIARTQFLPVTALDSSDAAVGPEDLARYIYPESASSQLIFIDGLVRHELSCLSGLPAGVAVLDFAAALESEAFGELMREYLGRVVDFEANGFAALNTALLGSGALIVIPKGMTVEIPLHLLFLSSSRPGLAAFPRVLLVAEENSSATVIESYGSAGDKSSLTNAVVEIVVKDGARLEHYRVQDEDSEAFHVACTGAHLGRNSSFDTTSISLGAKLSRHDLSVVMDNEGAECWVDGLYIMGEGQHTDTHSVIDHKQPHCTSHQLYKGILDGKSRAVFNGKVFVRHGALGTDANQTNKNLLLSNEAHVDTKPQLEIFADDVKCAHGAAIGQLDEDELFYLESRGIHTDLARNLLTYGFAEEVIAKIKIESIKARLDETVLNRLHARLEA